jgi:hypothetical protein
MQMRLPQAAPSHIDEIYQQSGIGNAVIPSKQGREESKAVQLEEKGLCRPSGHKPRELNTEEFRRSATGNPKQEQ